MTMWALSIDAIELAVRDFERENPGHSASEMTPKEFADRIMKQMALLSADGESVGETKK